MRFITGCALRQSAPCFAGAGSRPTCLCWNDEILRAGTAPGSDRASAGPVSFIFMWGILRSRWAILHSGWKGIWCACPCMRESQRRCRRVRRLSRAIRTWRPGRISIGSNAPLAMVCMVCPRRLPRRLCIHMRRSYGLPHRNGAVGVSDDPVGETYWKVSAMGFG